MRRVEVDVYLWPLASVDSSGHQGSLQLEDTGEKECEKDPEHLEMNLDLESDCLLQENFRTIELEYIDEEKEQKADIEGDRRQDSWEIQKINRKQRKAGNQGEVYLLF